MSDYSKQPSHELHTPRHETSSQGWLWGGLAALIAVVAIAWFMTSGSGTTTTTAPPAVTQEAPAPAPAAPAAEPAPATPPATGSGATTTPQ